MEQMTASVALVKALGGEWDPSKTLVSTKSGAASVRLTHALSLDIRTVAQLMRHRTIQMTMRDAHLAPEHNQGAVEKLVSPQEEVVTRAFSIHLLTSPASSRVAFS
jgi:hypothetical protein